MRELIHTDEFSEFYEELSDRAKDKVAYCLTLLEEIQVISSKLVKKLTTSKLYELRVSIDNEYRIMLFSVDNDNLINATRVILLNGFMKKSTKDYDKQIKKAERILSNIEL